jgi:signal transduction histidine kinase
VRDLAAGVAHEIGNPLNAISLNLQMLLREGGDTATVKECIHQVERLDGILKGFLQALRPSRPNLSPCSIAEPLTNCLKAMKPQFEERKIAVGVDVASALPMAAIDRAQMEQVFFNIVKNALEAMHDGGSLDIAVGSDDECVFVSIRDSGEGMPPERLARIFEPYGTTKTSGTGLGLMISSRIVRDHGGSIDAESAPGEGTVFTIRLPRIERRVRALKG